MRIASFIAGATLALATSAAVAQDVEALERQLDKAREAAPMVVKPFMAVARPAKYFGDYERRPNNTFSRGEQLHFYGEPKNLAIKNTKGGYEPAFEVDIEVKPEKSQQGQTHKQAKFLSMRTPSKSRMQDHFINMTISLGEAPPGKYTLKFTVRDLNSKKSADVAQDVVLK